MDCTSTWIYTSLGKPQRRSSCPSTTKTTLISFQGEAGFLVAFHLTCSFLTCFTGRVTPQNVSQFSNVLSKFNIGDDCPVFDGMYDYFKQCAGAAIAAGKKLAAGHTDIAIAWPGGLHHAKKFEASGFCYINDIVLAILELLRSVNSIAFHSCRDKTEKATRFAGSTHECFTLILTYIMATECRFRAHTLGRDLADHPASFQSRSLLQL